jgi:hypothetical protein
MTEPLKLYEGPERRQGATLSPSQLEAIAESAANRAVAKMRDEFFREFGRRSLTGLVWAMGALVVAGLVWAQSKGLLKS